MASINKVILIGNLGRDPEVRYMPSGDAVTTVTLATTDSWKDKNTGEKKESTEWHRVVFFRKLAEIAGQYLKKGSQIYVEGRLQTKKYQKEGVDHYSTEIVADTMQMLGRREGGGAPDYEGARGGDNMRGGSSARPAASQSRPAPQSSGGIGDFEDDIPF